MDPITIQMAPAARRVVEQLLAIQPKEHVLLITDAERPTSITQALLSAIAAVAAETILLTMKARSSGGVEPPPIVANAMLGADVIVNQSSYAAVHTNAVRAARAKGARWCDMWGFDEEMMLRGGIHADLDELRRLCERLAGAMQGKKQARMTTPDGTDLTISLEGRKVLAMSGGTKGPGSGCAIPNGEVGVSPLEGTAEGVLVNPYSIEKREIAFPKEPIRIEVHSGAITSVTGGTEAAFFARLLEQAGPAAHNIAEFSLGTNPHSTLGTKLRECKKAWGSAHIGIGDNKSLGGSVDSPLHIDLIFRNPTVTVDGLVLVKDGKILD